MRSNIHQPRIGRVSAAVLGMAVVTVALLWAPPRPIARAAAPSAGAATSIGLTFEPQYLALDADGRLYVSDCLANKILRVEVTGEAVVAAGTGATGLSGDGGPAADALVQCPFGLATDADGGLWFADASNNRVRRIDPAGVITTIVGTGATGHQSGAYGGEGGPAAEALLNHPIGIALDAAGNLYIADRNNDRVRKVDTNGIITTIAGDGVSGYSGDGGLATGASLDDPTGVAIDGSGNLYIADSNNGRIRRIDAQGVITTFAGSGGPTSSGDGGPAVEATLLDPQEVMLDGAGNLYVAETGDNRIRRVDKEGMISTFAGTGPPGSSGDGGPAAEAQLSDALGLAIDEQGNVYIADRGNRRIRVVDQAGTITTFADGS